MTSNFGTPKTASGFTLTTTNIATSAPSAGGTGDSTPITKPLTNLFSTPNTSGFSFGTPPKTTSALSFGTGTTTSASTPSFTLTPNTTAATPQFSLGTSIASTTPVPTTATSFTPIFASGTSLPSGLSLTTTTVTSTPLKLTTTPVTTPAASTPSFSLVPTSTTTTLAVTSTTAVTPAGSLTYAQLEDSINKWTIDLEEQGKFFINQAKQLNAWDNLLVSNSDKILGLNETIERVKQQQKQLDQELDFVLAQQKELDEASLPLEQQLADIPITDQSRFQTYQLSEIIDSQLKQMSEDLKEIVEHLNESNKDEDISDPVMQVSRILNAHMNSLQWIDRNTSQISSHLEQISQLHETYKKNNLNL